ncbi:hypothetical protein C8R46DRAFT_1208046 [Mycena filopes]|nr:hypothetical protein C8R46DRAFT_1208046 [Mycena filopes]
MDQISIDGVRYAQKNVRKLDQDSHIIFSIPFTDNQAIGEIINIFQYWHTDVAGLESKGIYLVVNRFSPDLTSILDIPDPYRRYPAAVGYLCTKQILETRIIESKHVWGHFALTPMEYKGHSFMHLNLENWWLNVEEMDPDEEDDEDDSVDLYT